MKMKSCIWLSPFFINMLLGADNKTSLPLYHLCPPSPLPHHHLDHLGVSYLTEEVWSPASELCLPENNLRHTSQQPKWTTMPATDWCSSELVERMQFLSAIRLEIGLPYIVTIWNVVFANKCWKLGWIWMKLGRWGWGLKRLSLARFQRNRVMGFGDSAKNGLQRHFLWDEPRTTSATFLGSISAKHPTNTCPGGGSRHMVSHSRNVSIKGSNFSKNPTF